MLRTILLYVLGFYLAMATISCASKDCRSIKEEQKNQSGDNKPVPIPAELDPMTKPPQTEKIKVYKPDGSLQCGQGKPVSLEEMQKQLGKIKVYASFKKNDGLMRIQLCGHPTGNSNVYEIHINDLENAIKLGFKEWTF